MALKIGVKRLKVMTDSMLVTKQINGIYDIRNERMKKYGMAVSGMATS